MIVYSEFIFDNIPKNDFNFDHLKYFVNKIYNDYFVNDIKEFMKNKNNECAIDGNLIYVYAITEFYDSKSFATVLSKLNI